MPTKENFIAYLNEKIELLLSNLTEDERLYYHGWRKGDIDTLLFCDSETGEPTDSNKYAHDLEWLTLLRGELGWLYKDSNQLSAIKTTIKIIKESI